jgi:hypothetical protein
MDVLAAAAAVRANECRARQQGDHCSSLGPRQQIVQDEAEIPFVKNFGADGRTFLLQLLLLLLKSQSLPT